MGGGVSHITALPHASGIEPGNWKTAIARRDVSALQRLLVAGLMDVNESYGGYTPLGWYDLTAHTHARTVCWSTVDLVCVLVCFVVCLRV